MLIREIALIFLGSAVLGLLVWGLIRGSRPIKWLCGLLLLVIMLYGTPSIDILFPTPGPKAMRVRCMNNLRTISFAIEGYRMEHGETNPPSLQALTNDLTRPELFVCIASGDPTGELSRVDSWTSSCVPTGLRDERSGAVLPAQEPPERGRQRLFP